MIQQATVPLMQNADSSPSKRVGFQQRGVISLPSVMIHVSIHPIGSHITTADDSGLVCKTTNRSRNLNKKEGAHGLTPFIHQFWARYQAYHRKWSLGAPIHREWKWSAKGCVATPKNRLGSDTGCGHSISCSKHGLQLERRRSDLLRYGSPNSGYISLEKTKRKSRQARKFVIDVCQSKYKMTGHRAWTFKT